MDIAKSQYNLIMVGLSVGRIVPLALLVLVRAHRCAYQAPTIYKAILPQIVSSRVLRRSSQLQSKSPMFSSLRQSLRLTGFAQKASPLSRQASTWQTLGANESQTITLPDDRTLGFATYGPEDGDPVFYFHGLPGSRIDARRLEGLDESKTLRFIGIDRPGIGLSTPKEGRTLMDWPSDVTSLAEHLGIDQFKVIGESGGGPYALSCARALSKDRLKATGVLYGGAPLEAGRTGMNWSQAIGWYIAPRSRWLLRTLSQPYFGKAAQDPDPKAMEDLIRRVFFRGLREDELELLEKPQSMKDSVEALKEAFRQGTDGYAHDTQILGHSWDFKLEDIDAKNVFLWYGEDDDLAPVHMARYLHERLKGSVLKTWKGETHYTLADEERQGKTIIRMLAEAE
ncbi:alpha/beta-hydrolase [Aaosphaeria arxii CBS 175.79]|uniref:Alpha/beta-hydrolase n=1 Tax=Aaosphaeria arxii CBS 175.79 TaxID=1450172 RepID=A0A6A5YAA1_9PLEO|nr:alpha/beta-hydrolase [Aaosphaeria arxii CBS 175.79]KAF2022279.1 alpha/beta-hydrolase [Aaosphaeria arxii CBS 175.79]